MHFTRPTVQTANPFAAGAISPAAIHAGCSIHATMFEANI